MVRGSTIPRACGVTGRAIAPFAAVLVLVGGGCPEPHDSDQQRVCAVEPECIADAEPRWIPTDCCTHSGECQAGLVCELRPPTDDDPRPGLCKPMPDDPSLFAEVLTEGFQVPNLPLAPTSATDTSISFSWLAPPGTTNVRCALSGCPPRIVYGQIVDFERCVVRSKGFVGGQGVFSPTGGTPPSTTPTECTPVGEEVLPAATSTLLVGCWAYGATEILAASTLQEVAESQVGKSPVIVDVREPCAVDGATCELAMAPQILGSCLAEVCRHRCTDDSDCTTIDPFAADVETAGGSSEGESGVGPTTAPMQWRCEQSWQDLGVCVPVPAADATTTSEEE